MSFNPAFWGPPFWCTFHSIAFNYPDNPSNIEISNMKEFMIMFGKMLPCEVCRKHFANVLNKGVKYNINNRQEVIIRPFSNAVLKSRSKLFKWSYYIHDYVNRFKKLQPGQKSTISPKYKLIVSIYNSKLLNKNNILLL